ncbi:MAG: class I SAM-dependent methyltransferase [Paludibacter sp.]|nr:class I SAM-dependent methyltransferase [Paludibacter sp.]
MNHLKVLLRFFVFYISAVNTKGYGIHSPYMFRVVRYLFQDKYAYYCFDKIEKQRKRFLNNRQTVFIRDFGTGCDRYTKISEIAARSVKKAKYGQLLFRLVNDLNPQIIVELGTSLGITTAYLASVNSKSRCYSFEGSPELVKIAGESFRELGVTNVEIIEGNIDSTLKSKLSELPAVDFIFIDANHSYSAVIEYFDLLIEKMSENAVIVVDDIYWSEDMQKAWAKIKCHNKVKSTIDIFEMGIIYLNPDLNYKNYRVRY